MSSVSTDSLTERLHQLESRIEFLEEQKRFTLGLLEAASSLGDFRTTVNHLDDREIIFRETQVRIRRLLPVKSLGFFLIADDGDLQPDHFWPEAAAESLTLCVDQLIDRGVLAWAIREKRPLFVDGDNGQRYLLHVLATSSRVRGMFVGEMDETKAAVYDYALALLSTLLLHSANALEAYELYGYINHINSKLQGKVEELAASEAELKDHRCRLQELVEARTSELTVAIKRLESSVAEKEMLIKEVHHRVKNNLQIISSLLSLQSRKTTDTELREALQEAQARIRSMALIHENLYRADIIHSVAIKPYIEGLCGEVLRTLGGADRDINLSMQLAEVRLSMDQAVPCGLVLNEILSNAFKHAFPDGRSGQIGVRFQETGSGFVLEVEDNGVGISAGYDPEQSESLGFLLITTLAAQLGGRFTYTSGPNGTRLTINFTRIEADHPGR